MKKTITLAAVASMMAIGTMNAETGYRLISVRDDYQAAERIYHYDDQNRVVCIEIDDPNFNDIKQRRFFYNEQGLCSKEEMLSDAQLDGNYRLNYELFYEYNEAGLLLKRTNYNYTALTNYEPLLGGVMVWEYDVNDVLVCRKSYRDLECTRLAMVENYYYNDEGQRIRMQTDIQNMTEAESNSRLNFYYDEEGRVIHTEICELSSTGTSAIRQNKFYVYDESGDLVESYVTGTAVNVKSSSNTYTYSNVPASRVVYPLNIEDDFVLESSVFPVMAHQCEMEVFSSSGQNGLVPLFEYEYEYEEFEMGSGIETVAIPGNGLLTHAEVNGDVATLYGASNVNQARVYGLDGRLLMSVPVQGNTFSVAALASGIYTISTTAGSVKFVR